MLLVLLAVMVYFFLQYNKYFSYEIAVDIPILNGFFTRKVDRESATEEEDFDNGDSLSFLVTTLTVSCIA